MWNFRFEALLGIAGTITLSSVFITWARGGIIPIYAFQTLVGNLTFVGAWLMIVGSLISYDVFKSRTLEHLKPFSDSVPGVLGGILGMLGSFAFLATLSSPFSPAGGVYLSIAGGLIGLISSILLFQGEREAPVKRKRTSGL